MQPADPRRPSIPAARARLLILTLLLVISPTAGDASAAPADAHEAGDGGHEADRPPHYLDVFGGATHARDETSFTLGVEYEYRFGRFGVGALSDHAFGGIRVTFAAVPWFIHAGHWKFLVAPGVEFVDLDEHEGTDGEMIEEVHTGFAEQYFALRLGVAYGFEITERFEISPAFDVDLVDEEDRIQDIYVLGVNFGWNLGKR